MREITPLSNIVNMKIFLESYDVNQLIHLVLVLDQQNINYIKISKQNLMSIKRHD